VSIARLVSGGQTGADRAALDVGRALGIPIGGWCPAGGWAEDLPDPPGLLARYPELRETAGADPNERTALNVRDSDATLVILAPGVRSPGTTYTIELLEGRPHLIVTPDQVAETRTWLAALPDCAILNVAGPRESQAPGHYEASAGLLIAVLA
jgi:hypothetical protein